MTTTLEYTRRIARKAYPCAACETWLETGGEHMHQLNARHQLMVQAAKNDGWHIQPGQRYIRARVIQDGEFHTVRARIDMDEVCRALDIYEHE